MKKAHKLIAAAFAVTLAGCTAITPIEKQYSGFLGDYAGLKEVDTADGSKALRWVSPSIQKGFYKKVVIPPVTFFPAPRTGEQVKSDTLNEISAYMTKRLREEVGKNFVVTTVPGPDTFNLQVAITGVSTPREGLRFYEVLPITLAFASATTLAGQRDHVTVVYLETLATDSKSGDELLKGVRQGIGEKLENDKQQLELEQMKKVIDNWAIEGGKLAAGLL